MKELCTNFKDVVVPVQYLVAGYYMMSKVPENEFLGPLKQGEDKYETVDDDLWDRRMMHL